MLARQVVWVGPFDTLHLFQLGKRRRMRGEQQQYSEHGKSILRVLISFSNKVQSLIGVASGSFCFVRIIFPLKSWQPFQRSVPSPQLCQVHHQRHLQGFRTQGKQASTKKKTKSSLFALGKPQPHEPPPPDFFSRHPPSYFSVRVSSDRTLGVAPFHSDPEAPQAGRSANTLRVLVHKKKTDRAGSFNSTLTS